MVEDKRPSEREEEYLLLDAQKCFRERLMGLRGAAQKNKADGGQHPFILLPRQTETDPSKQLLIWLDCEKNNRSPAFLWMTQHQVTGSEFQVQESQHDEDMQAGLASPIPMGSPDMLPDMPAYDSDSPASMPYECDSPASMTYGSDSE